MGLIRVIVCVSREQLDGQTDMLTPTAGATLYSSPLLPILILYIAMPVLAFSSGAVCVSEKSTLQTLGV